VHLNVCDAEGVRRAIDAIQASVTAYGGSLSSDRFLVERMVEGPRAEFIGGVSHKPGLGHALIIGRGGTAVEELRDFATLLLPVSEAQICEALDGLSIMRKLRLSDTDKTALADAIMAIARRVAEDDREPWRRAVDLLASCDGHVVVSGMGKSGLIGMKRPNSLENTAGGR